MQQCYINLSLIEHQHNDQNMQPQEKSPYSTFSLPNRLKLRADDPEKEVTLPQLFHERKLVDGRKAQPRRILIRGRAGVGKTTLCKKIVHEFLHKEIWATLFDRIIWVPLRRLKRMSNLDEFFLQEYFPLEAERDSLVIKLRKKALDQTDKRTLWLLDGLDEVSGYRNPSGADVTEIFNSLLNEDNVIITSRPHAVNLSGLTPFDLELETVGFRLNQVQTYLAKTTIDPVAVTQIYSFIQSHWLIQGLVRIPIQLDALCYSWDNDFRSGGRLQTMTTIYQAIEIKLWKKDILNLEKGNNTGHLGERAIWTLRTRLQIQSQMETQMRFLEYLAFTGLYSDIIEFHQDHRDWLYEQPEFCEMSDDVLDRLSFLRTSDPSDQDKSYHFLHLTFQEFFAAQYFVRCWRSQSSEPLICLKTRWSRDNFIAKISPKKFLREEKYSGRYYVFWRFVTGLLYCIDEEQVCSFLKQIEEEPRDLLGPAHQRLLMHCFSEVPQPENSALVKSSSDFLLHLREKMELGCIQWSHYEENSLEEMRLCSETEFPEHILCRLLEDNYLQKRTCKMILKALAHRWHISFNLMGIITKFMDDDDGDVRRAAIDALGRQSPWTPDILEAVTRRLDNEQDSDVRSAAIDALGRQSPWSPGILKTVIRRLDNDEHWSVRHAATNALGKQSPWSPDILEAILRRLDNDEDSNVRHAATDALDTQSPWSPDTLKTIMHRLDNNEHWSVRRAAIVALGTQYCRK
jgi:NACHT/LRR/PYD domain-containing protein 3